MKEDNREIEAKFPVSSIDDYLTKVREAGAICEQPVQFERNLRFDDNTGRLSRTARVLRLRDNGGTAVLTYKSDKNSSSGIADREEIETVVDDLERTRLILERLGFFVDFIYEKYRSIYSLAETGIFLDHTPIGDFIEIEGPDEEAIRNTAELLGLDWETRSGKSYRSLFKKWKNETDYPGRDMVFCGGDQGDRIES